MDLGLVIVDAGSIAVVLDDIDDEPRHSIQCLERVLVISRSHALDVAANARFCTDSKEEGRDIFHLQDSLLRKLGDEGHKALLRGMRALEDSNPLLEPIEELFTKLFGLRLRLHPKRGFGRRHRTPDAS